MNDYPELNPVQVPLQTNIGENEEITPSKNNSKLIVFILIIGLFIVGGYFGYPLIKEKLDQPKVSANQLSLEVVITENGFSPQSLKIVKGQTVKFINKDENNKHGVASDPFPTNDNLPGFNSYVSLPNNGVYTYTFDEVGTWGYYDTQNPENFRGTIIVEE